MGGAIVKLVMAVMMFSLPSLMNSITIEASKSEITTMATPVNQMVGSMSGITSIFSSLMYIMALGFAIKAILEIKEATEQNVSYNNYKLNIDKEIEKEEEPTKQIPVVLEKPKKKDYLDFENKILNNKVKEILEKLNYLKQNDYIKKDIELVHMVEKTESEYLGKIYSSYMSIPESKRMQNFKKDNPYDLTCTQLDLIMSGLNEMENKIVDNGIFYQKVNEKFLKEKVASLS